MPLKHTIDKLDEAPEAVRSMYKEQDGKYVLDVEGVVPKARLDEFRNNNIALQQQLDKLKDVDPVKYRELMLLQNKIKERELIDKGELDQVVNLRTENMRKAHEETLGDLNSRLSKAESKLSVLMIDNVAKGEAIKLGVLQTAVDDIILRTRSQFVIHEGAPVIKDSNGQVVYGKDGKTPMSIQEWMVDLKKSAPHLFQGSVGSGAGGGNRGGTTNTGQLTPAQKIAIGLSAAGASMSARLPGETS